MKSKIEKWQSFLHLFFFSTMKFVQRNVIWSDRNINLQYKRNIKTPY